MDCLLLKCYSNSLNFTVFDETFRATMCSLWVGKDVSNEPAVEPSLADSKPAEATEAVEVPWTCRGALTEAHKS